MNSGAPERLEVMTNTGDSFWFIFISIIDTQMSMVNKSMANIDSNVRVYSIQHYVMRFVSDFRQVGVFIRVLRFPPPTKTDRHDITEILLKVALNIIDLIKPIEHWHTNVKGKQIDDEYRFEPTNSILVLHSVIPISTFLFSETPFNGWKSQEHQQSIIGLL